MFQRNILKEEMIIKKEDLMHYIFEVNIREIIIIKKIHIF